MSENESSNEKHICCHICTEPVNYDKDITCSTCGHSHKRKSEDNLKTLIFSLTALILYIPANLFPFMTFELYGNKTESTIWSGIVSLADSGNLILAIVVFLASMLVPFIKLIALFYLSLYGNNGKNKQFKTKIFKFIETIGPWAMLDVFLLGILIAIIKLGSLATVEAGDGSFMFLFVVIFTIFASSSFNPQLIWRNKNEN